MNLDKGIPRFFLCHLVVTIILLNCYVISLSVEKTSATTKNEVENKGVAIQTNITKSKILKANHEDNLVETSNSTGGRGTNLTNSNYVVEYKPQVFESPEDIKTQQEWGGNCTVKDWDNCKALEKWFGKYKDPKDEEIKEYLIDCKEEPVICLKNSWTVTRCNLLCMSRCNREIQYKYDKYVSHNGECQAHAHG